MRVWSDSKLLRLDTSTKIGETSSLGRSELPCPIRLAPRNFRYTNAFGFPQLRHRWSGKGRDVRSGFKPTSPGGLRRNRYHDIRIALGRNDNVRRIKRKRSCQPRTTPQAHVARVTYWLKSPRFKIVDSNVQRFASFSARFSGASTHAGARAESLRRLPDGAPVCPSGRRFPTGPCLHAHRQP